MLSSSSYWKAAPAIMSSISVELDHYHNVNTAVLFLLSGSGTNIDIH